MSDIHTLIPTQEQERPKEYLRKSNGGLSFLAGSVPEGFDGLVLPGNFQFAHKVMEFLKRDELSLSVAESCTGGLLGGLITSLPGSSSVFPGGIISYSNGAKTKLLDVREATLAQHGAVSSAVALEMAQGVRKRMKSDYGISITGVAGPGGGSPDKPVGTVWFGISGPKINHSEKHLFLGSRRQVRSKSVHFALYLLLKVTGLLDKREKHKG